MDLSKVSDDELLGRVEALAETERFNLVDLLVHLGELNERDACEGRGFSSVFAYLTRKLGFAESDAIRRVRVARAGRKYPSILRMLGAGELSLVTAALIEPLLTSENHQALLRKAARRTTREVERFVADLSPALPEPKDSVRARPSPAPQTEGPETTLPLALPRHEEPTPSARRVSVSFVADEEFRAWFGAARDLLRHRFPEGRMEDVIGEALRRLVERERSARRREKPPSNTRRIPKAVEDEVWRRDGGRCAYVAADGTRCCATAWLEIDHVVPWSQGGGSDDPKNLRLLCRPHNQAEARRLLGDAVSVRRRG